MLNAEEENNIEENITIEIKTNIILLPVKTTLNYSEERKYIFKLY